MLHEEGSAQAEQLLQQHFQTVGKRLSYLPTFAPLEYRIQVGSTQRFSPLVPPLSRDGWGMRVQSAPTFSTLTFLTMPPYPFGESGFVHFAGSDRQHGHHATGIICY